MNVLRVLDPPCDCADVLALPNGAVEVRFHSAASPDCLSVWAARTYGRRSDEAPADFRRRVLAVEAGEVGR